MSKRSRWGCGVGHVFVVVVVVDYWGHLSSDEYYKESMHFDAQSVL